MNKQEIRKIYAQKRQILAKNWQKSSLMPLLLNHFGKEIWQDKIIASFIPFRSEFDLSLTDADLRQYHAKIAYPRVVADNQPLNFHLFNENDELIIEKFGTKAPAPYYPLVNPDILFVPLLAYSPQKYRLGYGGGFYDRTIQKLRAIKKILTIGVAFDGQLCEELPIENHDEPLDFIITENYIVN